MLWTWRLPTDGAAPSRCSGARPQRRGMRSFAPLRALPGPLPSMRSSLPAHYTAATDRRYDKHAAGGQLLGRSSSSPPTILWCPTLPRSSPSSATPFGEGRRCARTPAHRRTLTAGRRHTPSAALGQRRGCGHGCRTFNANGLPESQRLAAPHHRRTRPRARTYGALGACFPPAADAKTARPGLGEGLRARRRRRGVAVSDSRRFRHHPPQSPTIGPRPRRVTVPGMACRWALIVAHIGDDDAVPHERREASPILGCITISVPS